MDLDAIAKKWGTDKSTNSHGYTVFYERLFGNVRHKIGSLLEIGVAGGESIRMWLEFFPNARIYGLDQNQTSEDLGGRVSIFSLDQADKAAIERSFRDKKLEIIIDDASHDHDKTIQTLDICFPLLDSGGWHVIEDMNSRFWPKIAEWIKDRTDFQELHVFPDRGKSENIFFIHKD